MGGGNVSPDQKEAAFRLGRLIAGKGWILLNGGRNAGVMEASARGAKSANGMTIGILPDSDRQHMSPYIDIPIITGMGNARNCINVLSANVVVACPGGAGTLSEVAIALKVGRQVIMLDFRLPGLFEAYRQSGQLHDCPTPEMAIELIEKKGIENPIIGQV
jgi:uncharacterized protein (TIGR00725 family)